MLTVSSYLSSLLSIINIAKERLKHQQRVIFRNEIWKKQVLKQAFIIHVHQHSSTLKYISGRRK